MSYAASAMWTPSLAHRLFLFDQALTLELDGLPPRSPPMRTVHGHGQGIDLRCSSASTFLLCLPSPVADQQHHGHSDNAYDGHDHKEQFERPTRSIVATSFPIEPRLGSEVGWNVDIYAEEGCREENCQRNYISTARSP